MEYTVEIKIWMQDEKKSRQSLKLPLSLRRLTFNFHSSYFHASYFHLPYFITLTCERRDRNFDKIMYI